MNAAQRINVVLAGFTMFAACVIPPWKMKDTQRLQVFPSGATVWMGHLSHTAWEPFDWNPRDNDGIHWQILGLEFVAVLIVAVTLHLLVSPRAPAVYQSMPPPIAREPSQSG